MPGDDPSSFVLPLPPAIRPFRSEAPEAGEEPADDADRPADPERREGRPERSCDRAE